MKILTLSELMDLVFNGEINKIKMKTKRSPDPDHTGYVGETKGLCHFLIKDYIHYYIVEWQTEEGDPEIELHSLNDKIDYIADNSDSEYMYMLYID